MEHEDGKHSENNEKHDGIEIVVNGRRKVVPSKEISYEEVVRLAFDKPFDNPLTVYTVTYKRGGGQKPEGSLVAGETTKVKDGMIFNVTATTKS